MADPFTTIAIGSSIASIFSRFGRKRGQTPADRAIAQFRAEADEREKNRVRSRVFFRGLEDLAASDPAVAAALGLTSAVPELPPPLPDQPPPGTRPPPIPPDPGARPIPPGSPPPGQPPAPPAPTPPTPKPPSPLERILRVGPRLFGRFLFGLGDILIPEPVAKGERFPPDTGRIGESGDQQRARQRAQERARESREDANRELNRQQQPSRAPVREEIVVTAPAPGPATGPTAAPLSLPRLAPLLPPLVAPFALPGAPPLLRPGIQTAPRFLPEPVAPPGRDISPGRPPAFQPGSPPTIGLQPPAPIPGPPELGRIELPREQPRTRTRRRERCREVKRKRQRGRCFEGFYAERKRRTEFTKWREVDCITGRDITGENVIQFPRSARAPRTPFPSATI